MIRNASPEARSYLQPQREGPRPIYSGLRRLSIYLWLGVLSASDLTCRENPGRHRCFSCSFQGRFAYLSPPIGRRGLGCFAVLLLSGTRLQGMTADFLNIFGSKRVEPANEGLEVESFGRFKWIQLMKDDLTCGCM